MLAAVPFLLVPLGLYGVLVFVAGPSILAMPLVSGKLPSGAAFIFDVGTGLILLALSILLIELCKVARQTYLASIADPAISFLLVGGAAFAFATVPQAATSTFLILLFAGLIDATAGFVVWLRHFSRKPQQA